MSTGLAEAAEIRQREADALPVLAALRGLFPAGGLRRGSVTSADDAALLLALLAGPSAVGGWTAVVGMPECGVLAAVELGVAADRLLLVDDPGQRWAEVVAALLDGVQLVAVRPASRPSPAVARRLTALARRHGSALVVSGSWAGAEVNLAVTARRWLGVHAGHGCLRHRYTEVTVTGRGGAGRPRAVRLWLPAADGAVRVVSEGSAEAAPRSPAEEAIA